MLRHPPYRNSSANTQAHAHRIKSLVLRAEADFEHCEISNHAVFVCVIQGQMPWGHKTQNRYRDQTLPIGLG